jgi:shikimate dehydrogenase
MHNAAYRKMNLQYVMGSARVTEESLPEAIAGVRALNIRGLACTMPLKVSICSLLDELDPVARTIGAVNTVVRENDKLIGFNTDWLGILRPLESKITLRSKQVAVLGAGGAALAAVYACVTAGAAVTIFNRTVSNALSLAKRFGVEVAPLHDLCELARFDIIINTTSVGMSPNVSQSPLAESQIHSHQVIFETIYYPHETQLLRYAIAKGATILRGLDMFLEQGVAQFELHTGAKAPRETMRNEISSALVT